jgi:hypothetical protein
MIYEQSWNIVSPLCARASSYLRSALVLGSLLCVLLGARHAGAVDACVPPPAGVVGRPGPPDWTLGGTPEVDDPRWHGASGEAFPDFTAGGAPDARSRLVQSGGSLFLQLHILADATPGNVSGTNFRDSVYVAFADAAFANIQVVRIAIDSAGGTHGTRWVKSGGAWTSGPASPGAPTWLTDFTAWVNPPINGVATTQNWAVNFKIATASTPGTKFWYGTVISPSGLTAVHPYAWVGRGGFVEPNPPDTGLIAATWGAQFDAIGAANWGNYTTTTGTLPLPAGCQGVRIESDDIGTTNAIPWKINTNADNTFTAKLTVTGGAALPGAGAVKARFRIANWGMQIGVGGDWHDIAGGACTGGCLNDAAGVMQYSCPFVGPGSCPPHDPSAPSDQCMLVELSPAAGPVTFSKDSAWRNMIFGPASEFIHDAEISLVGLPPEPTPRDVYVYVKASNMPAKIEPGQPPPGVVVEGQNQTSGRDRKGSDARYRLEGLSSTELRILAGEATYEVRGYRDTGLGIPGSQVLTPMVPFGYMMEHQGPLVGWTHELVGVGTTVTTLIPGVLYKISVLPGGKARVQTRIHALEPGSGPPPICPKCCCDLAHRDHGAGSLGLVALLGLAFLRRRAQRPR